ncbi:MAG: hypothetical protein ACHQFW_08900 [Chitinophagales bacterium]
MKNALFFCITCLLVSCKYDDLSSFNIEGTVKDKTTLDVVTDATVYLLESEIPDIFGNPTPTYIVDSTTSDDSGKFEFSYGRKDGYAYEAYAIKAHYIDNSVTISIKPGVETEVLISPEAFLKLRVHNINEYDATDHVSINGLNIGPYYGNEVDTIAIEQVYGNTITGLHVFIIIDGVYSESLDYNIYCPSFDTTYYEILY